MKNRTVDSRVLFFFEKKHLYLFDAGYSMVHSTVHSEHRFGLDVAGTVVAAAVKTTRETKNPVARLLFPRTA